MLRAQEAPMKRRSVWSSPDILGALSHASEPHAPFPKLPDRDALEVK
jgi:hypothetical protein